MDVHQLNRLSPTSWQIEARDAMRVPVILYGDETLITQIDDKVRVQACNVASLPGIVGAVYTMPDAHWGYGFPIGGVAAFDADAGGVVSAGGVGFDISCGVRTLLSGLKRADIDRVKDDLADSLFRNIPAGVGSTGAVSLSASEMTAMLVGGADWAIAQGFGEPCDLDRIEEGGCMQGANPDAVSGHARRRQRDEMGTLGSGNHYLEVQEVTDIIDRDTAEIFGLHAGDIVISIHCGSRGLGHQIGTEFLKRMNEAAPAHGLKLPDRELACAPIKSSLGAEYLGAMRAGINCALANRQIITHLTREVFYDYFPDSGLDLLYDVSHNTCKLETHLVNGEERRLYVHRKGATRAYGSGHEELPEIFRNTGQPVLIGGSMGTSSHILAGNPESETLSWSSACHGAGRSMSRHQAKRTWQGRQLIDSLAEQGILVRSPSARGVAEEAPGAYKDVDAVVAATQNAGLARRVAKLRPLICIKG